jgi:regulatory protein
MVNRKYPPEETFERIKHWCDIQERAHSEVRKKLSSWGVYGEESENIIAELIHLNYLNEERFARAFARGKSRIKSWGWKKIELELKKRGVSDYSIKAAFEEIDREEYLDQLLALAAKKRKLINESDSFKRDQKLLRFLVNKGYSYEDAKLALNDLKK